MNLVERLKGQRRPLIGVNPLTTGIDGEGQTREILRRDAVQHSGTAANQQRCGE